MSTEERIEHLMDSPKRVSGDGMSVEEQTVDDVIKADRYLAKKSALGMKLNQLVRFHRLSPPGAS